MLPVPGSVARPGGFQTGQPAAPETNGLRLTTESGVPVSTADRTAQGTLYLTPFLSSTVALYDGSRWIARSTAEVSLALAGLVAGSNYDVFAYWTGSAVALELGAAWTSDTVRSAAVTTQDGVYVKTGALTRRLVGTIRATGAATTEDAERRRFLWNASNRVVRKLKVTAQAASWTYTTATYRQANADALHQIEFVQGLNDRPVQARLQSRAANSAGAVSTYIGIGLDSTTVQSAEVYGDSTQVANIGHSLFASYGPSYVGIGYHRLVWLEYSQATGTTTWIGNSPELSGLVGWVEA